MLGLIAPRRCHGCDGILEEQDPVYCAADFDLLQKERESDVMAARALYLDWQARASGLARLLLHAHEHENTVDYDKALAIARAIASSPLTETQRQAAERLAGV